MVNVVIQCNRSYMPEREYIYDYFFRERYGIEYSVCYNDNPSDVVVIELPNGKKIYVADVMFNMPEDIWLKKESLPVTPLHVIENAAMSKVVMDRDIIELYGKRNEVFLTEKGEITVDIFGSAFFLLTGYEELVIPDRNQFGNFPHDSTVIGKEGLIQRPLVDEYVELLWTFIVALCPDLSRKQEKFQFIPTHDIDRAFMFNENPFSWHIKNSIGDILKRRSLKMFWQRNMSYFFNGKKDPDDVYDWLMDLSDSVGVKSIFYFKNSMAKSKHDCPYRIDTKAVTRTLIKIDQRNHIIGFHPSFETLNNEDMFAEEINGLRNYCKNIGVKQDVTNIRHHYLRYLNPQTSCWHEKYAFVADATLGHRDHIGFRRGTSHEYYVYDLENRKTLNVREFPLIVMEQTMKGEFEGTKLQFEAIKRMIDICKFYNGNFVLLWHNETLADKDDKIFYDKIINYIKQVN